MKSFLREAVIAGSFLSIGAYADHRAPSMPTNPSCANSYNALVAVHELDDAAEHFANMIEQVSGYSHISGDVMELYEAASHLHEQVENGGSCGHLRDDFRAVEQAYRHVAQQLRLAHELHHNNHIANEWHDVARAFMYARRAIYGGRPHHPIF